MTVQRIDATGVILPEIGRDLIEEGIMTIHSRPGSRPRGPGIGRDLIEEGIMTVNHFF